MTKPFTETWTYRLGTFALFASLPWLATFGGFVGNLAWFLLVLLTIVLAVATPIVIVALCVPPADRWKASGKGRKGAPGWYVWATTAVEFALFAGFGWFWLAGLQLTFVALARALHARALRLLAERAEVPA